jgi:hypothetical protein
MYQNLPAGVSSIGTIVVTFTHHGTGRFAYAGYESGKSGKLLFTSG